MATAKWVTAAAAVGELQGIPVEEARRLLLEHAREGHLPMRAALFRVVRTWTTPELLSWAVDPEGRDLPPVAMAHPQSSITETRQADVPPHFFSGFEATTFGGYQGWCDWKKSTFTKLEADPDVHGGSITTTAVGLQFDQGIVATLKPVRARGKRGPLPTYEWEQVAAMLLRKALDDPHEFAAQNDDDLVEWVQHWWKARAHTQMGTVKYPKSTAIKNKLREWKVNSTFRSSLTKAKL